MDYKTGLGMCRVCADSAQFGSQTKDCLPAPGRYSGSFGTLVLCHLPATFERPMGKMLDAIP